MPKGFTLIELLIVVSIIGILSVALVPSITNAPAKARDAARIAAVKDAIAAIETYAIDNNSVYPASGCVNTVFASTYKLASLSAPKGYDTVAATYQCGSEALGVHPYYKKFSDGYAILVTVENKAKANSRYAFSASTDSKDGTKSQYSAQVILANPDDSSTGSLPYAYVVVR
jgi:prepilin-type N-terminal cleavage/methylation domain-containing protein